MSEIDERMRESSRGQHAQRLLDDPILAEAWATMDNELRNRVFSASGEEIALHVLAVKLLAKVKAALEETVRTGKMASIQLDDMRERARRGRRDQHPSTGN